MDRYSRYQDAMVAQARILEWYRTTAGIGYLRDFCEDSNKGHKPDQWYPSIQDHRQIWIHPYVKGPEGAPFVVKPRAWEFTR